VDCVVVSLDMSWAHIRRAGVRDEDGRGRGARLLHGVGHAGEDGPAEMLRAGLLGVRAADDIGAVVDGLLCVEAALLAGEALEQHLCVAVDAQVLDRLGVLRRACCVLPRRRPGQRRAHGGAESLHRDWGASRRQRGGRGYGGRGVVGLEYLPGEFRAATSNGLAVWNSPPQNLRPRP